MALEPAYLTEALSPATSQDGVTLVRVPLVGKALGDASFTREAGRPGRQGRRAVSPLDVRPGPRGRRGRPSPCGHRGACGRSERSCLPLPDAGPACCGLRVDGGPASGGPRRSVPSPGPCSRHPTRCRPAQGGCARLLPLRQCPPSCFPAPSTQGAPGRRGASVGRRACSPVPGRRAPLSSEGGTKASSGLDVDTALVGRL